MIGKLNDWLRRLSRGAAYIAALALVAAVLITVTDILLRHTVNVPVTGVVDFTQLMVMWAAFLSIPVAFSLDNHISVVMLTNRFSRRWRLSAYALSALACSAFLTAACFMAAAQAKYVYELSDRSMVLGIPTIWYWLPVIFGFALSACCALGRGLGYLLEPQSVEPQAAHRSEGAQQ